MVNCLKCGKENADMAKFCYSCGTPIISVATPMPTPPTMKPLPAVKVITPTGAAASAVAPTIRAPVRVPAPGMCFYHSNLPAAYVCNRCGRAICRSCGKSYMQLVFCPQCFAGIVPVTTYAWTA